MTATRPDIFQQLKGMPLGFLGPEGSNSHMAAQSLIEADCWAQPLPLTLQPCSTLLDTLDQVASGVLPMAVIPVENALEGSVAEVVEGLHQLNINLLGEFTRPIVHGLLVKPGTALAQLHTLYSHPQALGQCRQTVRTMLPALGAVLPVASTAQAAEWVLQDPTGGVAALGPHPLAARHGLQVLHAQMSDQPDNQTRFLWVMTQHLPAISLVEMGLPASSPVKTSIKVDLSDYPGSLVDVLLVFKRANLNLTKIESRPSRRGLGRYQFYMDVAANLSIAPYDELVKDLVRYFCEDVHVMGPYVDMSQLTHPSDMTN
jgi:prephenate dehydratase